VEADAIHVKDGSTYTSAGVTAGMDLALHLVEEDHGRDIALKVARKMVMFLKRPGGQSQFSAHLAAQTADKSVVREIQDYVLAHLGADLSVPALCLARRDERAQLRAGVPRGHRRHAGGVLSRRRASTRRGAWWRPRSAGQAAGRFAGAMRTWTASGAPSARRLGVSPKDYRRRFAGQGAA
jgi:hypothetical protein